jgi:hypothetical protein
MGAEQAKAEILERKGWTRRFIACEPRLSEAADMYENFGFDVRLEPLPKGIDCKSCTGYDQGKGCRICFDGTEEQYKIIFTRPGNEKRPLTVNWEP